MAAVIVEDFLTLLITGYQEARLAGLLSAFPSPCIRKPFMIPLIRVKGNFSLALRSWE